MGTRIDSIKGLIKGLSDKLNTPEAPGLQFKMNTEELWKHTISLRCNNIQLGEVKELVGLIFELAKESVDVVEKITVNKAFVPKDGKKKFMENCRMVYVTLRVPEHTYGNLWKNGMDKFQRYASAETLMEELNKL